MKGRGVDATGRSTKRERYVRLNHWVLAAPAWRALSCEARALLVALYELYNGSNNGALFLSVREAARRINTSKSTASGAFQALRDRGFIRPHVKGAFSLKQRHSTSWVLTEFEFGGQIPTKDFMRWPTASENQNTVRGRGQLGPPEGQMEERKRVDRSICPSGRTDSPNSEPPRSLRPDTDSLPGVAD
jgi:hypothetical protein